MNEDLKPCLDIESEWELSPEYYPPHMQVFVHKKHKGLFRVVDFEKGSYWFTDSDRVLAGKIIDINKDIGIKRKCELMPFISKVIDAEKPIEMPYVPETIKVYIENVGNLLGILYYKSSTDPENSIVAVKRFFMITYDPMTKYTEIPFDEYNRLKEEMGDVD